MTTATQLVTAALGKLLVRSADVPLEPDELQDGIAGLNRMMAGWNLAALTYTVVTSGSQVLSVPAYAEDSMVFGLAKRLASEYGVTWSVVLQLAEQAAMKDMRRQAITIGRSPMPRTLPRGSGNTQGYFHRDFYPPSAAELAE
jgi:hypothetical protein